MLVSTKVCVYVATLTETGLIELDFDVVYKHLYASNAHIYYARIEWNVINTKFSMISY